MLTTQQWPYFCKRYTFLQHSKTKEASISMVSLSKCTEFLSLKVLFSWYLDLLMECFIGFDPMQKINAAMSISWLQSYTDIAMLFQGQGILESLDDGSEPLEIKGLGARHIETIHWEISKRVASVLWPLDKMESFGGMTRLSDMVRQSLWKAFGCICMSPVSWVWNK